MNREGKSAVVDQLVREMSETETMFVADYRGLDVQAVTALRSVLRDADARFQVVKNTLAKRAAEQAGHEALAEFFTGPSAVAFVRGDAAAVAKALNDVSKQDDNLELKGGIMDGQLVDAAQVKEIANLPAREVILAMLLGAINGPLAQTVGVLSAPTRDIVNVLDAYIDKRKAEEGEAA